MTHPVPITATGACRDGLAPEAAHGGAASACSGAGAELISELRLWPRNTQARRWRRP